MADKNDITNNKNSLSLEEESILKNAMIFLQEEYNIKKDKLKLLRQELTQTKRQFQSQLQEYQKEIKLTIEKEKDIQLLFSKISKRKKRRSLIIKNSFNNKFYSHLLEISTNKKKEKFLKNFFSLIMLENSEEKINIKELIEILKNEDEIKNLLLYSYKIYNDIKIKDENLYNNLKQKYENSISDLKQLDGGEYPFDEMFECLGIIFEIIESEKNIKENNFILNKLIEKKNAKFVEIKNIENRIKNYYKNMKKIQQHIKIIHGFYDTFKKQNAINDSNSLKELLENIEEYKKIDIDYNIMNPNFDAITSLTFGTYCTQSEDSSIKSSTLSSKNKLMNNKLLKSNNKNNQFNTYEPKGDSNNILKNNKNNNKINKNIKEVKNDKSNVNLNNNKNNKSKNNNNNLSNENTKDNKKVEIKEIIANKTNKLNNNKYNNNNYIEIKSNKLTNKINNRSNKNKQNIKENKNIKKKDNLINNAINANTNSNIKINKNQIEEEKQNINKINKNQIEEENQNNNKINKNQIEEEKQNNNKINKIEEEKEIIDVKKNPNNNFTNLHLLGSKIDQLKHREPDDSVEMTMPKESLNKNYNIVSTEYNFNESSVCDEMISFNYDKGNNNGRSTTNDYINKIGVKNNVVLSQELYKNKLFMRRNNDFGKLKIEKSIEASTCCVSCT